MDNHQAFVIVLKIGNFGRDVRRKKQVGKMKRISHVLIAATLIFASLTGFIGCRDETDPKYNLKLMHDRPWREKALKNISEIFSATMQANQNDLKNPEVQKVVDVLVPGLIDGFKKFDRDKDNRKTIIELLAMMNDPRSEEVFLDAMELENTSDSLMFETAATAVRRQGVDRALPKLIAAANKCFASRDAKAGAGFSNSENAIVQAFIGSAQGILEAHPNSAHKGTVVEILIKVADTPDTMQELRLNMRAIRALGRIGDPAGIPVLIRGIAMRGVRQPVALGQFAFAALQQVPDRDAVVTGMLKFARLEDQEFMKAYEKEVKEDPVMKNPTWFIQQTVSFFGELAYPSAQVLEYLNSELNHNATDDLDATAAEVAPDFAADAWAAMRRNWAAVSLAILGQSDVLPTLLARINSKITLEEKVGYIQALGYLLMPEKSCPALQKAITGADDSLRDKLFYNASLMCGKEFLTPMQKAIDKIDCDDIIKKRFQGEASEEEESQARNECEIMKTRIAEYMDRIKFGEECGQNLECYAKTIADHASKNVERAIASAYRIARDNPAQKDAVVKVLLENLHNPSMVALNANAMALDKLITESNAEINDRVESVMNNFARQSTYKDRGRRLESFSGHLRARTK